MSPKSQRQLVYKAFSNERQTKCFSRHPKTIESSTGFALKKNTTDNLTPEDYCLDGDQELEKYLVLLLGLQRLLIWERQLLNDIIPNGRHTEVFSRLSHSSIDLLVKDAEISPIKFCEASLERNGLRHWVFFPH